MFKMNPVQFIEKGIRTEAIKHSVIYKKENEIANGMKDNRVVIELETLAGAYWGWKKHIPIAKWFQYELQESDKTNKKRAVDIQEQIDAYAHACAEILKEKTGLGGHFYFQCHPVHNDYCLFYQEKV